LYEENTKKGVRSGTNVKFVSPEGRLPVGKVGNSLLSLREATNVEKKGEAAVGRLGPSVAYSASPFGDP
jgi:hypothetical protein